jgi:YesN/AraC family two-component response regulator
MKEIWKDIPGYENEYQVSNLGRVKSLERYVNHNYGGLKLVYEKYMKLSKSNNGYYGLSLKRKRKSIHRLVAITFIENKNNLPCINHIDGDKSNNCVSNLEWVNYSQNLKHAFDNNLRSSKGTKHPQCKLTEKEVKQIRELYNKGLDHKTIADMFSISKSYVGTIGRKITWKHV